MGYTHYWRRTKTIQQQPFSQIVADFNRIVLALDDLGVRLADGGGIGVPTLTSNLVDFNGLANCGHPKNAEICIPWPSDGASGIGSNRTAVDGEWFAGAQLAHRACNGDCTYESFYFPRILHLESWEKPEQGRYFQFCKTAFRPYDVAVTAFLLIAKHHLGSEIEVSTDGDLSGWDDARRLCYVHLGYGPEFVVDDGHNIVNHMGAAALA